MQLLWDKQIDLYNVYYLERSACQEYVDCIYDGCYRDYTICVLKQRGYVDNENNINEAMYKLLKESNIGYVFGSEDERQHFLDIVKKLTKIDAFVDNHCYEMNKYHWKPPLHPNIYCPRLRRPGVTVEKFCKACYIFCSSSNKSRYCRILGTNDAGYCGI